ncbi:MAG: ADP-ribosylation factor-like protein [Promethearchaeota archaeon]
MTINSREPEEKKIVFAGLDNAGKTSFLIALRRKYNFYERVKNLKPTIKIDYSTFDFLNIYRINLWDMGGQAKYRKIYLNNPIYFTETNYFYFLIDIQDELQFEESVQYLHELLNIYRKMEYLNEVIVCFNKYDPRFKNNEDFSDRVEVIKKLILIQNKDLKFKFFNTSYYDISSLSKALSYSLGKVLNLEAINSKLESLVKKFYCYHAILYTNEGIIISDCYNETLDTKDFEELISKKINEDLEFFQRLKDEKVKIDERLTFSKDRSEYVKKFEVSSEKGINLFFLSTSTHLKNINELKVDLEIFRKYLESF